MIAYVSIFFLGLAAGLAINHGRAKLWRGRYHDFYDKVDEGNHAREDERRDHFLKLTRRGNENGNR